MVQTNTDGRPTWGYAALPEQLWRMVFHEFLCEPDLYRDVGLDELPDQLARALGCSPDGAVERVLVHADLRSLELATLRSLLTPRDMRLVSRTAAAVAAELKDPQVGYDQCMRTALCYAVADLPAHAFSALRAAASKREDAARHHFVYGLMYGLAAQPERGVRELELALQREVYDDARLRIQRALALLEDHPF